MEAVPKSKGAEDLFPPFTPEGLRGDVERILRDSDIDNVDPTLSPTERRTLADRYVAQVDVSRRAAFRYAHERGFSQREIALAATIYGGEIVRARIWSDPDKCMQDLANAREAVDWQNNAVEYILSTNEIQGPGAHKILKSFWSTQNKLMHPFINGGRGESKLAHYQNGILRPVALLHTLRAYNKWDAAAPPDPDDDALNKIDAVAQSNGGTTFVFQIKPQSPEEKQPVTLLPVLPDVVPRSSVKLMPFWHGIMAFARKYDIPQNKVVGVYAQISMNGIDTITGIPEPEIAQYIREQTEALDARIAGNVDNSSMVA